MLANQKLMVDPVINLTGNTYEREAFEKYFEEKGVDFLSQIKIEWGSVMKNLAIKNSIAEFLAENPWAFEFAENDNIAGIMF